MVREGDVLEVTRQGELSCKTLFYKSDGDALVGTPYLENILVSLEKVEDKKDDKVVVARFKSKSRYRRKRGHRQPISVVKVKSINVITTDIKPVIADDKTVGASSAKDGIDSTKRPKKPKVSSSALGNDEVVKKEEKE